MTFANAQLLKKSAEASKRVNKKEPATEKTLSGVWAAIEGWISSQFELTKGAHIPNFGKLCWVAEPTSPSQLRPTFVLLDAYAKSHALQCGRGTLLASTANRGWQIEAAEEMNFFKVALRFGGGLSKEAIFSCTRLLMHALGEAIMTGQLVDIKFGVGSLKARDRKVEFAFDPSFSRGRTKNTGTSRPAVALRPGSGRSNASAAGAAGPHKTSPAPSLAKSGASGASTQTNRQQQQQQQQQLFSVGAAGISGRPSPGPPSDSGSGITRSKAHQGAAAGGSVRKTVARAPVPPAGKSNKTPDADEDMEVMLMQGLQLKRPMGSAAPLPNSRPYGTDMDAIDFDLERDQRKQRAPQRRHFGTEVAKGHISGSAVQNIAETPDKGKRRSKFTPGSSGGALESAMQRHLSEQEEEALRDRTQAAEMELRKLELDREARGIMRMQKKERAKLKQELLGQMEAHEAARAAEQKTIRDGSVALIARDDPSVEQMHQRAENYRQELDGQVMEKAFTKYHEKMKETCQDMALISDLQEDLVAQVRADQERVQAAQMELRSDWEAQIAETRRQNKQQQQQPGSGVRPPSGKISSANKSAGEAVRVSTLSGW